ncbi:MAG: hypothetical protein GXP06_06395 [Alphaproteobacteria bacterium]|nr:hypothetical protein [Alphaproteobacteria bacterium]
MTDNQSDIWSEDDGSVDAVEAVDTTAESDDLDIGELTPADFDRYSLAASKLIEKSRLGEFGEFKAPFSAQFKTQLRSMFPEDRTAYDEADENERFAIRSAFWMRCKTFGLFFGSAFLIFAYVQWSLWVPFFSKEFSGQDFVALGLIVVVTVVIWVIRQKVRRDDLNKIGGAATTFANHFFKRMNNIHDRASSAVRLSSEDGMLSREWPDRSAGWIKISLWLGKRYEYLDRHVTAVAWRVDSRYRMMETFFRTLKIVVLVVFGILVLNAIFQGESNDNAPTIFATLAVISGGAFLVVSWIGSNRGNAYWAEQFRTSMAGFDRQKHHIHDLVANASASDKKWVNSGQRNVRSET